MTVSAATDEPQSWQVVKLAEVESQSSAGLHSRSLVDASKETGSNRHQLLTALSLLKHLAHNSPASCLALLEAGMLDIASRFGFVWKQPAGARP